MSTMKEVEFCCSDKLSSRLYGLKENGSYCDIELIFRDKRFPVHSCVVGPVSTYLDRVLSSHGSKVIVPRLDINLPLRVDEKSGFCEDCVRKMIDFMYCRRIQVGDAHLQHIHVLANALGIGELLTFLETLLKSRELQRNPLGVQSVDNSTVECEIFTKMDRVLHCKDNAQTLCDVINEKPSLDLNNLTSEKSCLELEWQVLDSSDISCPKCKETFPNVVMLQQHCNTHFGKYSTCYVCDYRTLKVPLLLQHLKETEHMGTVCSLCFYQTESSELLKEHLNEHDHPQPFFCRTCMTRFTTRAALNSHIVKHSTETPFICSVCGRGFKWKHGLQNHMKIHTSVKNHLCDQCGYSTAHLKSFLDHKIAHSGIKFNCPVPACQFTSVRKESVKHHLLTHSKEKPYQCEVCGQAFSQAKNLRRHATIHDPGTRYETCPYCTFRTKRSDKFKNHLQKCGSKNSEKTVPLASVKKKLKSVSSRKNPVKSSETVLKMNKYVNIELKPILTDSLDISSRELSTKIVSSVVSCEYENQCNVSSQEILLSNIVFDPNNAFVTSAERGLISLHQDQINLLLCNSENSTIDIKSLLPEIMPVQTIGTLQNIDTLQIVDTPQVIGTVQTVDTVQTLHSLDSLQMPDPTLEQIREPILLQVPSAEDIARQEVQVSCLSDPNILCPNNDIQSLGITDSKKNTIFDPNESVDAEQNVVDVLPTLLVACQDENQKIPFVSNFPNSSVETDMEIAPKLSAELGNMLMDPFHMLLRPQETCLDQ